MALIDKLTAIGDAIRAKTGKTAAIPLADMPAEIASIAGEELLPSSGYPSYVSPEVLEVANKVKGVRADDSIVFIAMSDTHYPAHGTSASNTRDSGKQASQAAKALTYLLKPDFVAHLGDVAQGAKTDTPETLKQQIEDFLEYFQEARSDIPVFIAIGNHDPGIYYHNVATDGGIHTLDGEYLYKNFTALSASDDTVFAGEEYGGYCYRDFADKHLRVFLLNTSEKIVSAQDDSATTGAQRLWLANALLELNSKADAADWSFMILCHYPADYGATAPLSGLLKAYVEGTSITISDPTSAAGGDGTNQTVNFSGHNICKMIAQFHGHVHNFKHDKLSYPIGTNAEQYDAWRVCIPNGEYNRENYYGTFNNINFAEETSYTKTAGTADGTSFVVNVVNPSEQIIYSFCYGAGYDRTIGYGATVYYTVNYNLTHVSVMDQIVSVEEGTAFSTDLTADAGYDMSTVTVKMGGSDITSSAYNSASGTINIAAVTGDIVITAVATKQVNYTNLVASAIDSSGASAPYQDGYYLASSGTPGVYDPSTTTGFIPFDGNYDHTYRIGGTGITFADYAGRIAWYDSSFNLKGYLVKYEQMNATNYPTTTAEGTTIAFKSDVGIPKTASNGAAYFRVSAKGKGANLIVTVDEPIE